MFFACASALLLWGKLGKTSLANRDCSIQEQSQLLLQYSNFQEAYWPDCFRFCVYTLLRHFSAGTNSDSDDDDGQDCRQIFQWPSPLGSHIAPACVSWFSTGHQCCCWRDVRILGFCLQHPFCSLDVLKSHRSALLKQGWQLSHKCNSSHFEWSHWKKWGPTGLQQSFDFCLTLRWVV